jgi:hypothetical protein
MCIYIYVHEVGGATEVGEYMRDTRVHRVSLPFPSSIRASRQDLHARVSPASLSMSDPIETIDARIATLQQDINSLRKQRNTLTKFCALPAELLVQIVSYLQRKPLYKSDSSTEYDGRWTRVAQVCSSVRATVLDARSLWASVNCRAHPPWIDLCLRRAGDTPLHLIARRLSYTARNTHEIHLEMRDRAGKHFSTCRSAELDIGDLPDEESLILLDALERQAPHLKILEIRSNVWFTITPDFLGGNCSTLQSLAIRGLTSMIRPPAFPALLSLELDTDWIRDIADMKTLLDFVAHATKLRTLRLERRFLEDTPRPIGEKILPPRDCLLLPHLESLELVDLSSHLHILLDALSDPSHHLKVRTIMGDKDDTSIWSPPGNAYFAFIHARLSSFWATRTGQLDLPGGKVASHQPLYASVPCMNELAFESPESSDITLSYRCQCRILQHDPLLDQVKTLETWGDRSGPGYGFGDGSGTAFLSALEFVLIATPKTHRQLQAIEKWLKQHVQAHGILSKVSIWHPAKKLEKNGRVAEVMQRLQKAGVAGQVVVDLLQEDD